MFKPLPSKEFKEIILKHTQILSKQNEGKLLGKARFVSHKKTTSESFKKDETTVHDLSKDFLQLIHMPKKEEESDKKYLLCQID